jgi:hypothetical protein
MKYRIACQSLIIERRLLRVKDSRMNEEEIRKRDVLNKYLELVKKM